MGEGVGHHFAPLLAFLGHVLCGIGRHSHATTLRGGECCGHQVRKRRTTTNAIYDTNRQGIPLVMSTPVSGSHNDLHNISLVLQDLFAGIKDSGLSVSELFLNADAGFDSALFRRGCHQQEVFPNVAFNKRRGMRRDDELLDELLYKERYSIERTNAWMDSYRGCSTGSIPHKSVGRD